MARRVVVTGMGVLACNGRDTASYWDALKNGRHGIAALTNIDVEKHKTKFGGQVNINNLDLATALGDPKGARRKDRFVLLALTAAAEAMKSSGLDHKNWADPFRVGTIVGKVRDADTQVAIANATVKVVDSAKKENSGAADQNGAFRFQDVAPGTSQLTVDAEGYLALTENLDVKVRVDNNADLLLKRRPKNANVTVGKGEIFIKQQIQFAIDSATILPESNGLLTEIADVLIKNPRIKRVEVQGHTDNTGTPDHNKQLSNDRAGAVVLWLSSHGVGADRMTAVGYGQSKPLVPNVTAGNRAKNRRVQFIIADQDPAPEAAPRPKKK